MKWGLEMANERVAHIDAFKGLLVLGMALAHVIQLLGDGSSKLLEFFSFVTNLVSFSGFLMCFGCVSWSAYLRKPATPRRAILSTACKCYLAFVFSGVAYLGFVAKSQVAFVTFVHVAFLRNIPVKQSEAHPCDLRSRVCCSSSLEK
jgi:hypothetical protein